MEYYSDFKPIPGVFWSFETGSPFRKCGMCDCDLMVPGTNYLIEKGFSRGETAFEYAMCFDCYEKTRNTFSKESRNRLEHFFRERVDFERRRTEMLEKCSMNTSRWLSHCVVKGTPKAKCGEYQIYGMFIDRDIVFSGFPYMISGEVMDEVLELLSAETRGAIDDLTDKLLGVDLPRGLVLI